MLKVLVDNLGTQSVLLCDVIACSSSCTGFGPVLRMALLLIYCCYPRNSQHNKIFTFAVSRTFLKLSQGLLGK